MKSILQFRATENLTGLIRNGSGVFKYVPEDTPSRELNIHFIPEDIESIFIEINLIKTKSFFLRLLSFT